MRAGSARRNLDSAPASQLPVMAAAVAYAEIPLVVTAATYACRPAALRGAAGHRVEVSSVGASIRPIRFDALSESGSWSVPRPAHCRRSSSKVSPHVCP
jgi:hypothetical protein